MSSSDERREGGLQMKGYCGCCESWRRIKPTEFGTCAIGNTDDVNGEFMWCGHPACEDFLWRDATTMGFCAWGEKREDGNDTD